jgi:hypothetical protein
MYFINPCGNGSLSFSSLSLSAPGSAQYSASRFTVATVGGVGHFTVAATNQSTGAAATMNGVVSYLPTTTGCAWTGATLSGDVTITE